MGKSLGSMCFPEAQTIFEGRQGVRKPVPVQSKEQRQEATHVDSTVIRFHHGLAKIGTTTTT